MKNYFWQEWQLWLRQSRCCRDVSWYRWMTSMTVESTMAETAGIITNRDLVARYDQSGDRADLEE